MVKVIIQETNGIDIVHSMDDSATTTCGMNISRKDIYDTTERNIKKFCNIDSSKICNNCKIVQITKWKI